jgi:hypothetical protein
MTEQPPEGPSLDDFTKAMRQATLDGMKDYDREREEWEAAVAAQQPPPKEEAPPKATSITDFLLSGKRPPKAS